MATPPKVLHSRPPLERMLRIHGLLQRGKWPNCSGLAKQLEISAKTAQRDLEFMRDRLGLPLEYDRVRHGYHYTESVGNFPTVQVTEGELVALLVAQQALEQYRGTPFERTVRSAVQKLAGGLEDDVTFAFGDVLDTFSFHPLGMAPTNPVVFEHLATAVRTRRPVSFAYTKPKTGRTETRNVRPYHLTCLDQCWYLIGHDVDRAALRLFALPRIASVKLGRKTFERPADFSARKFLANSFGAYAGVTSQEVRIEFDAFAAPYIQERVWHESQKLKSLRAGGLVLTMKISRLVQVKSWVLSWGGHAKVMKPQNLREEVAAAAAAILRDRQRPPD